MVWKGWQEEHWPLTSQRHFLACVHLAWIKKVPQPLLHAAVKPPLMLLTSIGAAPSHIAQFSKPIYQVNLELDPANTFSVYSVAHTTATGSAAT